MSEFSFNPKMKVQYRLVYCKDSIFLGDGRAEVQLEAALRGDLEWQDITHSFIQQFRIWLVKRAER